MTSIQSQHIKTQQALNDVRFILGKSVDKPGLCKANELINKILTQEPALVDAWILKCQILSALDDDVAALAAIEMAVKRALFSAEPHYWKSAVLNDLGRRQPALKSIDRAFRCLIDEDEWLVEDLFLEKVGILINLGFSDKALQIAAAGLIRCPHSTVLREKFKQLQQSQMRMQLKVLKGGTDPSQIASLHIAN